MRITPCLVVLAVVLAVSPTYGASGASLWKKQCASCHGHDGRGETKAGRKLLIGDLTNAQLQAKFSDEQAFQSIKFGLKDANGKVIMKPAKRVTDEEVSALVAHVRTFVRKVSP